MAARSHRLRVRRRRRAVLWGGRRGDLQVGSPADLDLARRRRAIADLDRRLTAAAIMRLRELGLRGIAAADAMRRMGEALDQVARAAPTAAELAALHARIVR